LNKFSKLIRLILENSRQEFIPLESEIDALSLYLNLEKERYSNFNYSIIIDENLKTNEYYIPTMIAQPFVENAILHGLRYKEEGGLLEIIVMEQYNALLLTITDNGIGRAAAKEKKTLKLKNKSSVGIKITEERIEKLNEIYPNQLSLNIEDLENEKGTKVTIKLPLITHKNLIV
jgi:two-component system, LytTR family, sensor kinase